MKRTKKIKKRSLTASVIVLCLCVAALIGGTFAWFTDTASTGVNKIQAGTLKVDLVDESGTSLVKQSLAWQKAEGASANEAVLWEPGCSYMTAKFKVANKGNLAITYQVNINGMNGSAKLFEVIDFYLVDENGAEVELDSFKGNLEAGTSSAPTYSSCYQLKGTMKTTAGNEYQGLSIDSISITVVATQYTSEYDSFNNTYDEGAGVDMRAAYIDATNQSANLTMADSATEINEIDGEDASGVETVSINTSSDKTATATVSKAAASAEMTSLLASQANVDTTKDRTMVLNLAIQTTGTTETSTTYDITVTADLTYTDTNGAEQKVENQAVSNLEDWLTATAQIGTGLRQVVVTHNDQSMTALASAQDTPTLEAGGYYYDSDSGILTIKSKTFSPFKVTFEAHEAKYVDDTPALTHHQVCKNCGTDMGEAELHNYYLSSDGNYYVCEQCGHEEPVVTLKNTTTSTTTNYLTLTAAIAAVNDSGEANAYVIELEDGIYNIDAGMQIDENAVGKSLTITAKNAPTNSGASYSDYKVVIKNLTNVFNNDSRGVFEINGTSSYEKAVAINIQNICFDMSNVNAALLASKSSTRVFAVRALSGDTSRYAHDVTLDGCYFYGAGGKAASAVGANQSNSSPARLTIKNCNADKLNCWFNGYIGNGTGENGFGLKITDCTGTNFLCVLNNQSTAPLVELTNVTTSVFYESTEYAAIYTKGGALNLTDCTFTALRACKSTNGTKTPAFIQSNGSNIGNVTITRTNATFTYTGSVAMKDLYLVNGSGNTVTYVKDGVTVLNSVTTNPVMVD